MINLFAFSQNDQSLCYLQKIFGTMNNVIVSPPGGCDSSSASTGNIGLLGAMFQTFNTVVLAVGALIVVYITVVGVMATAHEGKFMGEKWNGLWTPLRTVVGIAALVPFGSGYSAIQIVMMWVIVQGIGAADTLWSTTLGAINVFGSPFATPTIPSISVSQNLTNLFQALVCDATAKEMRADPSKIEGGGYYCNQTGGGTYCTSEISITTKSDSLELGPGGVCGKLTYCNIDTQCAADPNSLKCLTCQAQVAALQDVVPILANIAKAFEETDFSYRDFYANSDGTNRTASWSWIYDYCRARKIPDDQCCVKKGCEGSAGNFFDPNSKDMAQNPSDEAVKLLYFPYSIQPTIGGSFIATTTGTYMNLVSQAVNTYVGMQGQKGNLSTDLELARVNGWILAGSYYYAIGKLNSSNTVDALPPLDIPSVDLSTGTMSKVRNNYNAASVLLNAAANAGTGTTTGGGGGGGGGAPGIGGGSTAPLVGPIIDKMTGAINDVASAMSPSSPNQAAGPINPLAQLQTAGYSMLMIAQIIFVVFMVITFALGIAGNISVYVLGTGAQNPVGGTAVLLYFVIVPLIFGLLGLLISIGGLLGIYVPLIPFIVYTTGVIGWFLATVETMVASPLVALGILSPSAHGHELLGKAEHALTMIFNVFLRPSLMVFGLMAAMLLANVVISMINWAFWNPVFAGVMGMSGPGGQGAAVAASVANPLAFVIFLTAYVMFILAALNKCFSAIHLIPAQVMGWIGGQGAPGGGGEAGELLGEVKGGTSAAAGRGAGAYGDVREKGVGVSGAVAKKKKGKKDITLS